MQLWFPFQCCQDSSKVSFVAPPAPSPPPLFSSLPNLEELNLRKCQISDEGISELAKGLIVKRNIKKLSIGCVGRGACLRVCVCVRVCMCACVSYYSSLPSPPTHHISANQFGSSGLTHLVQALAYNPVLEELEVTKLGSVFPTSDLSNALAFLFRLTVSLKKVSEATDAASPLVLNQMRNEQKIPL